MQFLFYSLGIYFFLIQTGLINNKVALCVISLYLVIRFISNTIVNLAEIGKQKRLAQVKYDIIDNNATKEEIQERLNRARDAYNNSSLKQG